MKWFKFYGQDYLSDPKILALSASERSCWITLLSYASVNDNENDNGVITFLSEEQLMMQAGISPMHEEWEQTTGVLNKLQKLKMITIDNEDDNEKITILNWLKRQEKSLTGYERVKKYREKKRNDNEDDNAKITLDKIRIDKNRVSKDTLCEQSSQNAEVVKGKKGKIKKPAEPADEQPKFEGKQYLDGMLQDKQKHVRIIALFLMAKKIVPENEKQMATQLKRNLRAASDLSGYEGDKIKRTMVFLRDFGPKMRLTKWTLETVGKYIDDDLVQMQKTIEEKNNSKVQKVFGENIKI